MGPHGQSFGRGLNPEQWDPSIRVVSVVSGCSLFFAEDVSVSASEDVYFAAVVEKLRWA